MMKGIRFSAYLYLFSMCIFLFYGNASAQAPFLSATASKSTVGTDEQFQLTYTINANGRSFQGPDLSDFYVHSGPNQSTSMQYINGNFSQSLSLSYILQPKKEGNYKIGPASIETEGKRIVSNVVNLSVIKGTASRQNAQQNSGNESGLSDKNIFIRAVVNKTNVYQGEAVVVSFRIYTNVSILNYTVNKMPAFNGFFSQDIQLPEQLELSNENVNGVNYRTGEIKKLVLFPQQSGELVIDPMELECIARLQVKVNHRDPFGMFQNDPFFGMGGARDVKFGFKSNSIRINVKPLPDGAPASFNGTVGKINFSASLDKETTRANEPITCKIKISGSGNMKLTDAPQLNLPPDFEVYDPKVTENIRSGSTGSSGTKTFEYLIIPRNEGTFQLEPIEFSWFDLEKKQYVRNSSKPFTIKVNRGSGTAVSAQGPDAGVKQSDVQVIGRDIRYIKLRPDELTRDAQEFFGSTGFYALTVAPLLLFGGLLFYRNRMHELNSDATAVRTRKATGAAQKRLSAASEALQKGEQSVVYEEISKALWGYVSDKLLIDPAVLTKEKASAALLSRNVSTETIEKWKSILQDCEMARYGGTISSASAADVHRQAMQLITSLENSLKA